jgi:hypothetical protein
MQLTLKVSVPDRSTPLCIHRATVLWVHDHEFAIETHEMVSTDQAWVTEFLRQKLGLRWMSRTTNQETSLQAGDETPRGESAVSKSFVPSVEDILHRFSAIVLASTDMLAKARQRGDSDFQKDEIHIRGDYVLEKTWREARRIVRRMVSIKSARVRTGRNPIPDN